MPQRQSLIIRAATAADLPACAEIINDYIDATEWLPRTASREEIAANFEPGLLQRRLVLVAENEGAVVGYMTMSPGGMVPALYLVPAARGQGIGKALLDRAKAESHGIVNLTVFEPNHAARRFYDREGFSEVPDARKIEEEGIPILLMRWSANPETSVGEAKQ